MAILNFAKTYAEISDKLQLPEANSGDYIKLYFSKDGHIISHGTDYTPTFSGGPRGLVPQSDGDSKKFLRGNGSWAIITTADLPMATTINNSSENSTTLMSTKQIVDYIGNNIAANDAMRFKGSISKTETGFTTTTSTGTVESFPTSCQIGDTYRIGNKGSYFSDQASIICSTGDLIICIKDGSGPGLNTTEYWTAVESNINGTSITTVNNTQYQFYSPSVSNSFTIYAPTTGGTSGQLLKSNGTAAPTWINQNTIIAGDIISSAKEKLLTSVTATNGTISVTVGGTTKSATASGTWGINISGSANSVSQALSAGIGLSMQGETYNGSTARTIFLTSATRSSLGGVIIDKSNEEDKKTISVDEDGNIYLTQKNIINALGYVPGSNAFNKIYTSVLSSSATGTTDITSTTTNPYYNLVSEEDEIKTVTGSVRFIGSQKITVQGTTSKQIVISLGAADDTSYGGIKLGYDNNGKNYALELDSNGKAFVNVPWVNTTYGLATATSDGLVPKFDAVGTGALAVGSWVLAKLANGTYDWFALPSTAFTDTNTWRPIQIGGTSIGDKTLNFIPTGDIYLKADSNGDNTQDLSFGLSWYNVSTDEYEYE